MASPAAPARTPAASAPVAASIARHDGSAEAASCGAGALAGVPEAPITLPAAPLAPPLVAALSERNILPDISSLPRTRRSPEPGGIWKPARQREPDKPSVTPGRRGSPCSTRKGRTELRPVER